MELLSIQQNRLVFLAHYTGKLLKDLIDFRRWDVVHVVLADVGQLAFFLQFSQVGFECLQNQRSLTVLFL